MARLRVCFLHAVAVFFCFVSVTECQLDFEVQQTFQGIQLLCSVGDLRSTSLALLDSLLIFRSVAGTRQILASLSTHQGPDNPVSHLTDAQITGHLDNEGTLGGFLKITWDHSQADIDGEYICDLNGVDKDYVPITLSEQMSVQVKSMCPCFESTPEVLRLGLTQGLEIVCYIPNNAAINISQLASLEIIIIRDGAKQILAEINSLTGIASMEGDGVVNGSLGDINTFLHVVWEYPPAEMASDYICEGSGVGIGGDPVFFSKNVKVSVEVPDSEELIQRLFEVYEVKKELKRCHEEINRLTQTSPATTSQVTTTSPTTTRVFPRSCEDANLPVGQNTIIIQPDDGLGTFAVLCEVVTPQEVWTVFQKRFDGSVSFYRGFNEYKNGFGNVNGEFWLGLDNIRRLLLQNKDNNRLKIDLREQSTGVTYNKTYPVFTIGPGDNYILSLSGVYNDSRWGISTSVGQMFSTYDHGLSALADFSNRAAGWWFDVNGGYVNINGIWGSNVTSRSMFWYEFRMSFYYPMDRTEMKFRRN
ncbi:hypothetical protein BsWGS_25475 [Bradybaena similaris]